MEPAAFEGAVRRTADRYGMDLSRPLAMVSGGPDSVALLRALVALGGRPVVLHVDHGLRGEESRQDAEFVRRLCGGLGLRCEVRRLKLAGANLQERAREERYRIAGSLAEEMGLSSVATGHTADDVAETVLLNLARGAGLRGLAGIPPVRGRVVRPLIHLRRADVLAYLGSLGQPYRTDLTNLEPKYARNRVRLEVLPVLEDLYPGAVGNIARTAALLREDLEALEGIAGRTVRRREGEVALSLAELRALPVALRRHAVRLACEALAPGATPGFEEVERVLELADEGSGTRLVDLPGRVVASVRAGVEVAFYIKEELPETELEVREGEFEFAGWKVRVDEVRELDAEDASRPEVAYLDARRGPYAVRLAREGDTIRPLGLGGKKKVMRAMMDRKVPKDLRRRTPVVVGGSGEVAWIFCGELGEEFKVGAETALRLEVARIP